MNRLKFLKKIETDDYLEIQNAKVDLMAREMILLVKNNWGDSEVIVLELIMKDKLSYHLNCWRCNSSLSPELKELSRLELALHNISEAKQIIKIVNLNTPYCNLKRNLKRELKQERKLGTEVKWFYIFEKLPVADELEKQLLTCPQCQARQDFVILYSAQKCQEE